MTDLEVKCPRCGTKTAWKGNEFRPFCSEKCRLIDLAAWSDEDYTINGGQAPCNEEDSLF